MKHLPRIPPQMDATPPRTRLLCTLLALTLGSALLLASEASPPTLEVRECLAVENGTPVLVVGVVVDVRSYDSGTETLKLLDRAGGPLLSVICLPEGAISLSRKLMIGDLVRVDGEVSRDASETIVFTTKGRVAQVLRPHLVLSVELLCENWRVFEFDRFNISGALLSTDGVYRLQGLGGVHSVELRGLVEIPSASWTSVTVDGTLLVDESSMVMFLKVHSISAM